MQHFSDSLFCHQFLCRCDEDKSEVDLQCVNKVQVQTDNAECSEVANVLNLLHSCCSVNDLDTCQTQWTIHCQ